MIPIDPERHCVVEMEDADSDMIEFIEELGYTGEGQQLLYDINTSRYILMNNFYVYHDWDHEYWDTLRNNLKHHQENYGFQWMCFMYPPLDGKYRKKIQLKRWDKENGVSQTRIDWVVLHRGSCLWVSWDTKRNKRRKK